MTTTINDIQEMVCPICGEELKNYKYEDSSNCYLTFNCGLYLWIKNSKAYLQDYCAVKIAEEKTDQEDAVDALEVGTDI